MRSSALLLVSGALLAGASPAAAQLATGRSGSSSALEMSTNSDKVWWSEMRAYGICLVNSRPRDTGALLATRPGTPEEVPLFNNVAKLRLICSGEEIRMSAPSWMIRGSMAEAAYREVANRAKPPVNGAPATAPGRTMSESADCFVTSHAADVHSLLYDTAPGSKPEGEAVGRLFPDYQKCLPEGVNLRIGPTQLRYAFAEALYRATPAAAARLK